MYLATVNGSTKVTKHSYELLKQPTNQLHYMYSTELCPEHSPNAYLRVLLNTAIMVDTAFSHAHLVETRHYDYQ